MHEIVKPSESHSSSRVTSTDRRRREAARTISLVILACVGGACALYFGREFFQPIAVAFLLTAALRPVVRGMGRLHIPPALGGAIVVLALMFVLAAIAYLLSGPVERFVQSAPESLSKAQQKFERLRRPFDRVFHAADTLEHATSGPAASQPSAAPSPVAPQGGSLITRLFGTTTLLLGGLLEALVLLYLLLASGDLFLQKLVRLLPIREEKRAARSVVHDVEHVVMRYLLVMASINFCQAVLVTLIMWWLKMPSPILWGCFCFVLEFVPYLGAAIMVALLTVTSFATFDSWGHIVAPPICYFCMTTLNTSVISPYAYGAKLKLNPVAVLIGVLLWWYLWGIPGAFVAVPILAAVRIATERTESLKGVAEFLAE